jgi:hypothetical protein
MIYIFFKEQKQRKRSLGLTATYFFVPKGSLWDLLKEAGKLDKAISAHGDLQ